MKRALPLALLLAAAAPAVLAQSGAPSLSLPIDCDLGETCYIQQYKDRDPGPGVKDFTCGPLAYDGHEGTDFAVPTLAVMRAGVAVLAPAPGVVLGIRDGMPDVASNDPDAPALDGRDCGNGIAIDHGGGWHTQLCHLKRGSVQVRSGDRLERGQRLAEVGLSGRTEFPHLHLSVRQDGRNIDPFHPGPVSTCGTDPQGSLWVETPAYQPGGIASFGLADSPPEFAAVLDGDTTKTPSRGAQTLIIWAVIFGAHEGDEVALRVAHGGEDLVTNSETLTRTQARIFRFAGRRMRGAGLPAGDYAAEVTLMRGGEVIDSARQIVTLR